MASITNTYMFFGIYVLCMPLMFVLSDYLTNVFFPGFQNRIHNLCVAVLPSVHWHLGLVHLNFKTGAMKQRNDDSGSSEEVIDGLIGNGGREMETARTSWTTKQAGRSHPECMHMKKDMTERRAFRESSYNFSGKSAQVRGSPVCRTSKRN